MAADTILIKFEEVLQNSRDIDGLNVKLRDTLDEIKKCVTNLDSTWESEASTSIREKMKAMDIRFNQYEDVVSSYTKFLQDVVKTYQEVESKINKSANLFS